ncbi:hypothetical protein HWI79_59 [Cryptosporidium felis]|nr:hypothetical protein HWI79_59 [Cryptosporidium felis]
MDRIEERIRLMAKIDSRTYSDDEVPIITPCSVPYFHTSLNESSFSDNFVRSFPPVKVYSEWDGTYVTFYPKTAETTIGDLKNYIGSLRDPKRIHSSSLDSQASTMDSLNSPQERQSNSLSLFSDEIQIYGEAPGVPKQLLLDSDLISQVLEAVDSLKLYYSRIGFEYRASSCQNLQVVVYPKANFHELGVKCSINFTDSGITFTPEKGTKLSNRVIYIDFGDINSIAIFNKVENCLLIKRKTVGKNPFLVRTYSKLDFIEVKRRLKQISEIQRDSRLISDADSRISKSNLCSQYRESTVFANTLVSLVELLDSEYGKNFLSSWFESFEKPQEVSSKICFVDGKLRLVDSNCILTRQQVKTRLLNRERCSTEEEVQLNHLKFCFEEYLSKISLTFEDIWQVN